MKKAYLGSCHCGAVRFQCELDLGPVGERSPPEMPGAWWASTFQCNCPSCRKLGFWKGFVRARDFHLHRGAEALTDYRYGERMIHHRFCSTCGVLPFAHATLEQMGGEFYAVNIWCLDDATPEELARAAVTFEDGRHDGWDRPPPETRHR